MTHWLLAAEADKIQDFLFRSSRLAQVAGGSAFLARFCREAPSLCGVPEDDRISSLARECILSRQLAYGARGNDRRQLFISGHRGDLTSHFLELPTSTEGRKMRLSWFPARSPDQGPSRTRTSLQSKKGLPVWRC